MEFKRLASDRYAAFSRKSPFYCVVGTTEAEAKEKAEQAVEWYRQYKTGLLQRPTSTGGHDDDSDLPSVY